MAIGFLFSSSDGRLHSSFYIFELYKIAGCLYFQCRAVAVKTCSDVP
jgi:hypothetical protein